MVVKLVDGEFATVEDEGWYEDWVDTSRRRWMDGGPVRVRLHATGMLVSVNPASVVWVQLPEREVPSKRTARLTITD